MMNMLLPFLPAFFVGVLFLIWIDSLRRHRWRYRKLKSQGIDVRFWPRRKDYAYFAGVPSLRSHSGRHLTMTVQIIFVPIICFAITSQSTAPFMRTPWKAGFRMYAELFLGGELTRYFAPFVVYSFVSAALLLIAPKKYSYCFFVRLGIYTGAILALPYALAVAWINVVFLVPTIFFFGLCWFLVKLSVYTNETENAYLFWTTLLLILGVISALVWQFEGASVVGFAFFALIPGSIGLLVISPFFVAVRWAILLWPFEQAGLFSWAIGWWFWLVGYLCAGQLAITRMFEIYATLRNSPVDPGNCYVATAAAQGYPDLVGSFAIVSAGGERFRVNRQLQRLKGLELVLLALAPQTHESVRRVYDVVGRKLARKIRHPAVATVVYWSLKPVEWGMVVVLWGLGSKCRGLVDRFYR